LVRAWLLVIIGIVGLVCLRQGYLLTYEPAPSVRVRWRDGTSDMRRRILEMKYRLAQPAAPEGLSYAYVLLDTSRRNIETMIKDPEVADTGDIDRKNFEVPWETAANTRTIMWAADRVPWLRQPAFRWALIAAFACVAIAGSRPIFVRAARRVRG
jgi:hypothetical protein